MTTNSRLRIVAQLGALCWLTACGSETKKPSNAYSCVMDEAAVSQGVACARDVDCPCGTHCSYGSCRMECKESGACAGGWCDAHGRCRDAKDRAATPPVSLVSDGQLTVTPKHVKIYAWSPTAELEVGATRSTLDRVRIVAPEGAEIRCDGVFGDSCELKDIEAGSSKRLAVRIKPAALKGEVVNWPVKLHYRQQLRVAELQLVQADRGQKPAPGRYEGRIWLAGSSARLLGATSAQRDQVQARAAIFALPVELKIYADDTVVITDTRGVFPRVDDKVGMVFKLRPDGTFDALVDNVDLSRRLYYGAAKDETDKTATEVVAAGKGRLKATATSVSGELELTLDGLGQAFFEAIDVDERPRTSWQFHVRRMGDVTDAAPALGAGDAPAFGPYADRYEDRLPWELHVTPCGGFGGADHTAQLAHYVCYNHPGDLTSVGLAAAAHVDDLSATGDLRCDDTTARPSIFPLFTAAERSVELTPAALLVGCIADLERVHAVAPDISGGCDATSLDQLTGCGSDGCTSDEMPLCVDGPLALAAIGFGLDTVSLIGQPDLLAWSVSSDDSAKLTHRLIQQWLQVHTFVAREATQQSAAFVGKDLADLQRALDLSLSGWRAFLHPKLAGRLMHLPASILANPDYRNVSESADKASADRTQNVGMPVVVLEAVVAQLAASRQLVHRARFESKAIPDAVRRTLRVATIVIPLAQLLHARAASEGEPSWQALWQRSRAGVTMALRALLRELDAYDAGDNPLGITEQDLPLYRGLIDQSGAGQRFSAASRYLLDTFADPAVKQAESSAAASKAAWEALLTQKLQKVTKDDKPDRIAEIKRQYGDKIFNLCGDPHSIGDASLVFDQWDTLSPHSCFIKVKEAGCNYTEDELLAKLSVEDVKHHVCVMGQLRYKLGDKARLTSSDADRIMAKASTHFAKNFKTDNSFPWEEFVPETFAEMGKDLYSYISTGKDPIASLYQLESYPDTRPEDEQAFFDARALCDKLFPKGKPITERFTEDERDKPECYQGAIGELVLQARAAAKDVEIANGALQDYSDAYEKAIGRCVMAEEALKMSAHATKQLGEIEGKLMKYTSASRGIASFGSQLISTVANIGTSLILGDPASAKKAVEGGVGGLAGSAFDLVAGKILEFQDDAIGLTDVREVHAAFVKDFAAEISRTLCFADAEMHLVGADTQLKRLQRSKLDLANAILKVKNGQRTVARLITEAARRVKGEQGRERASLFNNIWNDLWEGKKEDHRGAVVAHAKNMRLAQRMLYLAVRAVEYEWQVTSTFRSKVLEATTPLQLKNTLDAIRTEIATGKIGGQSPEDRHAELSLKDQLMQLADRSEWPDGQHRMSATERFRSLLTSPRYAYFNNKGEYQGQLIPFSVAPLGVLKMGRTGAIPLLTGSECAERHWSVNATLHGEKLVDGEQSYASVQILQKNTFYSQWCQEPASGAVPLQTASVRPSRNLFKDPVLGGSYGSSNRDDSDYVRALVDAYFNIDRKSFEEESYSQGASDELAGRGLYGEYAVFFPKEQLAIDDKDGLHLERIDDILIRFDYVSAAKTW